MNATYDVVATRSGVWWTVEVTSGLPADVVGVSQARRLTEAPAVARHLIGDLLDVDPAAIDVNLLVQLPSHLQEWVESYRDAEVVENIARSEAALARSRAAAALLDARLTMRETAVVLGVSHQRIKQLADRAPDTLRADLRECIVTALDVSRRERTESLVRAIGRSP